MGELPEKFPEYIMMHKTLSNQINVLKKRIENEEGIEIKEIQIKMQNYELELIKIKKMFPENFFEELD
jgi:CO dehydrogenase/acetyl-CoA synthase delta subunit